MKLPHFAIRNRNPVLLLLFLCIALGSQRLPNPASRGGTRHSSALAHRNGRLPWGLARGCGGAGDEKTGEGAATCRTPQGNEFGLSG